MVLPSLGFTAPLSLTTSSIKGCKSLTSPARPSLPTTAPTTSSQNDQQSCQQLRMAFTSIGGVLTPPPITIYEDTSTVIKNVYTQVFGNQYLMDSELEEIKKIESEFTMTKNVREFVRSIANSDTYKERFFHSVSQYRFIELIFKHLLGRAPDSLEEYAQVMNEYHTNGYESCIDLCVDSVEYDESFGTNIVPYGIYKGCYVNNELFNRSVAMRLAPCSSDKGRSAMLQYCVPANESPNWLTISKALPSGTEKGTGFVIGSYWQSTQYNKNGVKKIGTKVPGGVIIS